MNRLLKNEIIDMAERLERIENVLVKVDGFMEKFDSQQKADMSGSDEGGSVDNLKDRHVTYKGERMGDVIVDVLGKKSPFYQNQFKRSYKPKRVPRKFVN